MPGLPEEAGFAIDKDPVDPEHARYAPVARPRFVWMRRIMGLVTVLGLVAAGAGAGQWWTQQQYFVGQHHGVVTIYRGVNADLLGYDLSTPYEGTNLLVSELSSIDADSVTEGMDSGSLAEAKDTVTRLYEQAATTGASGSGQ